MAKRAKAAARKPRRIVSKKKTYPLIQVEDGRIWMQNVPNGRWIKVPPARARGLVDRLERAIEHVQKLK